MPLIPNLIGYPEHKERAKLAHTCLDWIPAFLAFAWINALLKAFKFTGYDCADKSSGLALVIPYPHGELTEDGINASAIEHFAPAILSGQLHLTIGHEPLTDANIKPIASQHKNLFGDKAIEQDCFRYINLVSSCLDTTTKPVRLNLEKADKAEFKKFREKLSTNLASKLDQWQTIRLEVTFPLQNRDKSHDVSVMIVAARTPAGKLPIDKFFRDGMSLPKVKAKTQHEIDLVVMVKSGKLSDYLNLCEGKAHLDLLGSIEVKDKLDKAGYSSNCREVKLVKSLCTEIRSLLIPDITEPDRNIFADFFSIPKSEAKRKPKPKSKPDPGDDPPHPPPPRVQVAKVNTLDDGFRILGNPDYDGWPRNIDISVAYADGSRKPRWEKYDFLLKKLDVSSSGCVLDVSGNTIRATDCTAQLKIVVTGFDANRELDVRVTPEKVTPDA